MCIVPFLSGNADRSSSSSSPLLSQVPAKLAINLSIHTQHTYDNGVDRTGRQGMEEKYSIYMRREKKKKNQTMLHWEYSVRTEKKTPQHKSTYTIDTTCNRGKHIQLWQAAIRSGAICGAGHRPARQVAVQSVQRQFGRGRGSNVCDRGGNESVPLQCSFPGINFQQRPCRAVLVRGSQKIRLRFV